MKILIILAVLFSTAFSKIKIHVPEKFELTLNSKNSMQVKDGMLNISDHTKTAFHIIITKNKGVSVVIDNNDFSAEYLSNLIISNNDIPTLVISNNKINADTFGITNNNIKVLILYNTTLDILNFICKNNLVKYIYIKSTYATKKSNCFLKSDPKELTLERAIYMTKGIDWYKEELHVSTGNLVFAAIVILMTMFLIFGFVAALKICIQSE
ncbi:hypothetical protein [Carp edema virus]|nr:hypothetical protein [Carp edema virus]